jgi:hypothetical protein
MVWLICWLRKKHTGPMALAGKKAGGFLFALIFFVTFFYQEKKVNELMNCLNLPNLQVSFKTVIIHKKSKTK